MTTLTWRAFTGVALLSLAACEEKLPESTVPPTEEEECVQVTWYADADGDGHGVVSNTLVDCSTAALSGYVTDVFDDCNDTNPQVHPGLDEVCDGIDQDCDAQVDEDAVTSVPWYADLDGDSYGDAGNIRESCEQPPGFVADATDCDDYNADVNPGGLEVCNQLDDDCDTVVDNRDAMPYYTYFYDKDGDTFGDPLDTVEACERPDDALDDFSDCDDRDPAVFPGAEETCNDVDDDCDGTIDDPDALPYATWYIDDDGDTFGDVTTALSTCHTPKGMTLVGSDCDDTDPNVNPDVEEACNTIDDDCNGIIDDPHIWDYWYVDVDADGYGDESSSIYSCSPVVGRSVDGGDCDDSDASINPGMVELCNSIDDDCDGTTDDPDEIYHDWYIDMDEDGYGDSATAISSCLDVPDRVLLGGDCDDIDPGVNPGMEDLCGDGIDLDCSGSDACRPAHMSEVFTWTATYGQYCGSPPNAYYRYYGELTFDECQEKANATGTQWFVGISSPYTAGWIGDQDETNAVSTSPADWTREVITPRTSLKSCTLAVFDHRTAPTVSPAEETYVDALGRVWHYWQLNRQTASQAISFADDLGARIINPNSVGLTGLQRMTAPTHWCHASAQFNGGSNCNTDNICDFIVGYYE
jgi:hypothetical protein